MYGFDLGLSHLSRSGTHLSKWVHLNAWCGIRHILNFLLLIGKSVKYCAWNFKAIIKAQYRKTIDLLHLLFLFLMFSFTSRLALTCYVCAWTNYSCSITCRLIRTGLIFYSTRRRIKSCCLTLVRLGASRRNSSTST